MQTQLQDTQGGTSSRRGCVGKGALGHGLGTAPTFSGGQTWSSRTVAFLNKEYPQGGQGCCRAMGPEGFSVLLGPWGTFCSICALIVLEGTR